MAKTIQEMAMDYASEKWEGEHFTVAFCDSMEDFLKGANAVLEEVENIINKHYHSEINWEMSLRYMVKRLRGE